MRILQRHYIGAFIKMLSVIAFGLALIFSFLELIDKIDDFIPGKLSVMRMLYFVFLNLPKYIYYILPMSLLIGSLFIFSQASRNKELVVIKASGGKLKALFYPFVVLGISFSLLGFVIGEIVVPDFSERLLSFKEAYIKKSGKVAFKEGTLWLRGTDGSLSRIELYIPDRKLAKGVSIFKISDELLKQRIEAEAAEWIDSQGAQKGWRLKNATVYDFNSGKVTHEAEMVYPYLESPDFFSKRIKSTDEMGIDELYRYAKRLEGAGIRNTKLIVDMNSKVSYPLANFSMMLLGIALSLAGMIRGGLFAAGIGISISFIYWLAYTFVLSLGYARILPPLISTWMVPILFGIAAVWMFKKIPE